MKRIYLLILLGVFVSGCSSTSDKNSSSFFSSSAKLLTNLISTPVVTKAQANKLPYASIYASFGGGAYGVMVLGFYQEPVRKWHSADHYALAFNGDQIQKIYTPKGVQVEAKAVKFYAGEPFKDVSAERSMPVIYKVNFPEQNRYGLLAEGELRIAGEEVRTLWGEPARLQRLEETLSIKVLNKSWVNIYWRDPRTGFIWESEQYWGAGPNVKFQVLKPWMEVFYP
ncbi:YjbF family lipoprotein [Thiomicrorhabdus sp. 6S3-12]|uniref:YjbF family lipoprotein n=1 Tax=Thiomicrorhabdus sp. 6S3-12 TaxID=2819681 RepID=UPI001AAC4937|nr:YjbF family lipoprotein [Thiomicrorhabdus sp. 6S3-12]MBO1924653.1 YjbF family lipoprotein [Thiomicrorhabdus sp. 6S3-12]